MSQTNVQSINNSGSANTLALVLGTNVVVGNLIVIGYSSESNEPSGEVTSITDSLGNTYSDTAIFVNDATNVVGGGMWYGLVTTGGACTITMHFAHSITHRAIAHEFSNTNGWNSSPFDIGTGASGASGVTPASGSSTSTGSDDLLFGFEFDKGGGTHAQGSGWTLGNTTGGRYRTEYQLDVAAGAFNSTWATNATGAWVSSAGSFKTASGGGTVSHLLSTMGCGG